MQVALLWFLIGGVAASLRQPSRQHEVDDVTNIMEKVRQQTEGGAAKHAQSPVMMLPARNQKMQSGEFFAGEFKLDDSLMSEADHTQDILKEADRAVDSIRSKKASLVTKESKVTKAGRYFANHGMDKVAQMLGSNYKLAATAEKGIMAEHKADQSNVRAPVSQETFDTEDLDMPDDDADEVTERQHWAAVDALRKRKTAVLAQEKVPSNNFDIDDAIHQDEVEERQHWAAVDALKKKKAQMLKMLAM